MNHKSLREACNAAARRRILTTTGVVLGLLLADAAPAAAGECTPNLEAQIASPLRTVRRPFDHRHRGRFAVKVRNTSDCRAEGRVGIKPLMLPAADVITHGDHTHPSGDGRVLPTRWVDVGLAAGASASYILDGRLPQLDRQTWRLTAIVDSAHRLPETDELDNVPDLVSAGYLGVARTTSAEPGIDFTSTLLSRLSKQNGGVAHTLGLHSRPMPTDFIDSHDVGSRFLLADVATGKVYTLIYAQSKPCKPECEDGLTCEVSSGMCVDDQGNRVPEIDKEYYAIAWNGTLDELGRPVVTDVYWQAPQFVDRDGTPFVPPGDYRFLTVMDSWDRVDEHDETNNVDAVPFTLAPLEVVGFPNTWFVSTPGGPAPTPVVASILNSYSANLEFTVTVPGAPPWLGVTPTSDSLAIDQQSQLTLTVTRGSLTPGTYHAEVVVTATGFEAFPVSIPVVFYVYGTAVPGIAVDPTALTFSTTVGVHPATQTFELSNPGTMALDWEAWPSVEWISVAPPMGTGPAGYQEDVSIIIHPEGMAPGGPYIGSVEIFSSAPDGGRTVTAQLVVGPCEQGWCDMGWTCNVSSHLCEPPTACNDHGDCPTAQQCSPTYGYCEPTAGCNDDLDCVDVWSEHGALECNETRMTCELATCAVDEDCPLASYCNEPAGICPRSGFCSGDDECYGNPFAFQCDEARSSCEPAVCNADVQCPAASYCSTFWNQCVQTAHCDSDVQCYPMGLSCDESRDACRP